MASASTFSSFRMKAFISVATKPGHKEMTVMSCSLHAKVALYMIHMLASFGDVNSGVHVFMYKEQQHVLRHSSKASLRTCSPDSLVGQNCSLHVQTGLAALIGDAHCVLQEAACVSEPEKAQAEKLGQLGCGPNQCCRLAWFMIITNSCSIQLWLTIGTCLFSRFLVRDPSELEMLTILGRALLLRSSGKKCLDTSKGPTAFTLSTSK